MSQISRSYDMFWNLSNGWNWCDRWLPRTSGVSQRDQEDGSLPQCLYIVLVHTGFNVPRHSVSRLDSPRLLRQQFPAIHISGLQRFKGMGIINNVDGVVAQPTKNSMGHLRRGAAIACAFAILIMSSQAATVKASWNEVKSFFTEYINKIRLGSGNCNAMPFDYAWTGF